MLLNKKRLGLIILVLLMGAIYPFLRDDGVKIFIPVTTGISILFLLLPSRRSTKANTVYIREERSPTTISELSKITQRQVNDETANLQVSVLGSEHRKAEWQKVENLIDEILDSFIKLIQSKIDAHTIAVFFPSEDGGFKLKKYSSKSEYINSDAVIYPGVGVIGGFLKDGLKRLNLPEIVSDSMTLYYYKKDAGIRSLMASPITAGGTERGTLIVDSTDKQHFSDEDHAYLSKTASLLGQVVYSTYLSTEHKLEHIRLAAMSSIEKEFFRNLNLNSILDKMADIIPFAVSCDRLTISIKSEAGSSANILRSRGIQAEWFQNRQFSLKEKNLACVLYSKNISICRNFSKDRYEARYCIDEPIDETFSSFLAVPIGTDESKGMILLESTRRDAFSESHRDLLSRIATSAALAIEKILIFEKAENMATHDGLTGLFNHRRFQQILKDEITRAIRYNDPLALVISDIDFFKKINDTYGHQFGDTVLKGVAAKLNSSIRDGIDTASRYGGEEFALVLVKTDEKSAAETVERIRQQIGNMTFKGPTGEDVKVTMSFGIALYRQHARQIDELIKKADKALYRAKENGRNRVEIF